MSRKAMVTGGAGFIGSHLVDLLVDQGWELLVVDDLSSGRLEYIASARRRGKVGVLVEDIRAPELSAAAARFDPEVVFHLAAQSKVRPSVEDPLKDASINVLGTVNVLQAAVRSGARRVVFASSGGAIYGGGARLPATERTAKRPESPYGITKKIVEDYFRWFKETYGLDYVLLAMANIYGPRQDPGLEGGVTAIFAKAMLEGRRPTIFGDGTQTRDYVFVEDTADAYLRAADRGRGVLLNIGSGRETSVLQLYEMLARITGFPYRPEFTAPKPGDIGRSVVDPGRAKKVLGWQAWTPLEEGLRRTVEWYRGGARG
ncbi:MAG: NAD-dependent epimerase/dehydratase family protein [Acidimicrobiia bacterium]|nr:NAD-dependent epimerase/dehydratase family protein [Acidimicrobiia bacterium]